MLRFKFKYLFANKQTRLILLLTICVSLSIMTIGLLSYSKYRKVLDTELNTPNVELLQINLDVTNRAFKESDMKAVDVSFHPATLDYASSGTPDNVLKAAGLQSYLQTLSAHPDIHSIAVIKFKDRSMISSQFGYKSAWEAAPDTTWIPWIGEIEKKPLLVKRRMYGGQADAGQVELLSLARPIVQGGQMIGAVMVNLDYDRLFSKIYTHLSNYQYVYNLEGDLIYPKLNLPISPLEMSKVIDGLDYSPFAYVKVEGQDFMANQTFSDVTGWRLVSLVPMEQLLKNVRMARDMMLLLSLISILVGCSAMYYYNYAAFRPLKRINKLLNSEQKSANQGGLHDLEPVIDKLVGDFHNKSLVAERSLPELRSKYIHDVLTRSIGSQEIRTKWEHYFQDWGPAPLVVLVVSIDRYWQWTNEYLEEDQMLLKYALNNIVLELLEPSWNAVSVAGQRDYLEVVLQAKDNVSIEASESLLERDAAKIIQAIAQYLTMSVSIGIGAFVTGILHVDQSHMEAEEALSYRLHEGYSCVLSFSDMETAYEVSGQSADDQWQAEVIAGLRLADSDTCANWIHRWGEDTRKKESQPQQAFRAVNDLMEELLRVAAASNLTAPAELADHTLHQVTTMELGDIEDMLCRIVKDMCEGLGQRRQSKEQVLVQAMIRFMEDNLHLNIGLQDIADHVSMGISSVSNIFKEETGNTVYDYLTTLRIDKACQLLRNSQLKVADIATLVGYQNENSFIRAFRKNKSITPGKFRESYKSSNEYADPPKPRHSGISEDGSED